MSRVAAAAAGLGYASGMRLRAFLVAASTLCLAALLTPATGALLDGFLSVVDARRADPGIRRAKLRVLTRARDDLRKHGLLLDDVRNARRAVQRVESVFRRDAEFDAAEAALVGALHDALDADRALLQAREESVVPGPDAKPRSFGQLAKAASDLSRAAAAKSPVRALTRLVAAAHHLRRAAPPQPDFRLPDVNPASATFGTKLSPRDDTGVRTAWYFLHGT